MTTPETLEEQDVLERSWCVRVGPDNYVGWDAFTDTTNNHPDTETQGYFYGSNSGLGKGSSFSLTAERAAQALAQGLKDAQENADINPELHSAHAVLDGMGVARGPEKDPLSLGGRVSHAVGAAVEAEGARISTEIGGPVIRLHITHGERDALVTGLWNRIEDEMADRSDVDAIRKLLDRIEYMKSARAIDGGYVPTGEGGGGPPDLGLRKQKEEVVGKVVPKLRW